MVICSLVWDYTIGVVFYWPICGFTMFWPTPGTPEKTLLEKRGISYLFENVSPSLKATFDGGTKLGQFMPRNWISFVVKCRRKRQGTEAGFGRQRLVASKRVFFKRKMDLKKKWVKSTSLHWFHQDIMQILFGGRFGIKNHSKSRELSSWTVLC